MTDTPKPNRRGLNLSQSDRERGGKTSAAKQRRDSRGQFAGSKSSQSSHSSHAAHTSQPPAGVNGKHSHGHTTNREHSANQTDDQYDPKKQHQHQNAQNHRQSHSQGHGRSH